MTTTEKIEKVVTMMDCEMAFAVPGQDGIIDVIHPGTGKSWHYGKTLDEIRLRYPGAEIVNFEDHCASQAKRQDAAGEWIETTAEHYDEMLNVLPPASWVNYAEGKSGFLVGEPCDHHAGTGRPRFSCFKREGGKFHTCSRPITFREFQAMFGETARYCYNE